MNAVSLCFKLNKCWVGSTGEWLNATKRWKELTPGRLGGLTQYKVTVTTR